MSYYNGYGSSGYYYYPSANLPRGAMAPQGFPDLSVGIYASPLPAGAMNPQGFPSPVASGLPVGAMNPQGFPYSVIPTGNGNFPNVSNSPAVFNPSNFGMGLSNAAMAFGAGMTGQPYPMQYPVTQSPYLRPPTMPYGATSSSALSLSNPYVLIGGALLLILLLRNGHHSRH